MAKAGLLLVSNPDAVPGMVIANVFPTAPLDTMLFIPAILQQR